MPNRKVHTMVGVISGSAVGAAVAARRGSNVLLEGAGAGLGGWLGARLPDLIDPPTSPRHRSVGHGMAQTAVALSYLVKSVPEWQEGLRRQAARELQAARESTSGLAAFGHGLAHVLLLLAAGAVLGLVVGYVSHLVLDATTASGLPFVA